MEYHSLSPSKTSHRGFHESAFRQPSSSGCYVKLANYFGSLCTERKRSPFVYSLYSWRKKRLTIQDNCFTRRSKLQSQFRPSGNQRIPWVTVVETSLSVAYKICLFRIVFTSLEQASNSHYKAVHAYCSKRLLQHMLTLVTWIVYDGYVRLRRF